MIYFDNSATTNFKPLKVRLALLKYTSRKNTANPGRSSHKLSMKLAIRIFNVRENFNNYFNNNSVDHVIFTSGCSESLNLAIFGTLKSGGHIITTSFEHNSCLRPIEKLSKDKQITYSIIQPNLDGGINISDLEKLKTDKTYLMVVNHTSNVTGATNNISEIGKFCKKNNIIFVVDGAQSAGHEVIDMQKQNIDILCLAGHKGLFGPQGIGVLLYKKNIEIKPIKFGGTGIKSEDLSPEVIPPESLEVGTVASPNIMSLNEGLNYVKKNLNDINNKLYNLSEFLYDKLSKINEVKIYTSKANNKSGIISFNINQTDTNDFVNFLSRHNVCVRGGLHCAPLIHKQLGTIETGCVRISLCHKNTKTQIIKFIKLTKQYINSLHSIK